MGSMVSRPLVNIVDARARSGRGSLLGDSSRRVRIWDLTLACGHHVQRMVKYGPDRTHGERGRGRSLQDAQPAPKRARCDSCPRSGPAPAGKQPII